MAEVSPNDQFQKVLTTAEGQFKKKKIAVRFGPWGKMRFIIDEPSLNEALSVSDINEHTFRTIFDNEIGPLLEATIRGAVEQYVQNFTARYTPAREQRESRESRMATLRERAKLVENALVSPELRGRYLIKVSSKHPRLRTSDWEVAKKLELSTKEPWLQPYATISFETVLPPEASVVGFGWLSLFTSEPPGQADFCTFDCDQDDLDDLIESLQRARTALRSHAGAPNA